jgi:hypothetical protein
MGFLSPPEGFNSWDEYDRFRKETGPSLRKSYPNKMTEAVATNPVFGLLVPGAEQFLQKGGEPSLLDIGLSAADVITPGLPLAAGVSKAIKKLIGKSTNYDNKALEELAEKIIRPSGQTDISKDVVYSKKVLNKRKDGSLSPLFHEKNKRFEEGVWHKFESDLIHPTKTTKEGKPRSSANLAYRPGFYGGPKTPQIKMGKVGGQNRVKREVAFRNWTTIKRPAKQGGEWYLSAEMMILPRKKK